MGVLDCFVEFRNPAGEIIPTGPCRRSRGNALSLFEDHADSGILITPKTAQSQWLGDKMDDDLAILIMLQLEQELNDPIDFEEVMGAVELE